MTVKSLALQVEGLAQDQLSRLVKKSTATETLTNRNINFDSVKRVSSTTRRMTHCSESNQEATMPTNLLSTQSSSILGTWYVRTMYQSGKATQIAKEMHKYNIEVMGLSETRWISTEKTILATGEVVLYSGHQDEDSPYTERVAFMMTK